MGSGYADVSCRTGEVAERGLHKLCDHDLRFDSKMYGGNLSVTFDCNALFGLNQCYTGDYVLTDELLYDRPRLTRYYAIAGIDYNAADINCNDYIFEMPTNFFTSNDISNYFKSKKVYKKEDEPLNPAAVGDNMVGFLSQIGWVGDNSDVNIPAPRIQMEKICIDVDANGGNGDSVSGFEVLNMLHGKIPHRNYVMYKVYSYLIE